MEMSKAMKVAIAMSEISYLGKKLDGIKSGYEDEWVLKNSHTCAEVDISYMDLALLKESWESDKDEAEAENEKM